jgi:hydrogenase maturation protein HypF
MSPESLVTVDLKAVRVSIVGRVQGLGVRPAAARLAARLQIAGSAMNTADGLTLELEGSPSAVEQFLHDFPGFLPADACFDQMLVESLEPQHRRGFRLSAKHDDGSGTAAVPLDRIVCENCLREVRRADDRRAEYPFTSCTSCGPRYSIVEVMPYDRAATTMDAFRMCDRCRGEYRGPEDRRFHAQTNACPRCGPQVRLVDEAGRITTGGSALDAAAAALGDGRIVALKGLGGYQLLVDATSVEAVRRLRERKGRKTKPLAVLVRSLDDAERLALLNDAERRLLADPAGPIVVVRRRAEATLTAEVAPGSNSVGLMLPTTPLHALLCDRVRRPLVCTSGNREGKPLAYDEQDAERELRGITDVWLHHNRTIARPVDDSVVRVVAGSPCFLRMARGYAPLVLPRPVGNIDVPLVALGGEQKSAIALWNGSQAVLGPHVGDLTDAAICERWVEQLESLATLYGISLDSAEIVHDRHPNYFSTGWGARYLRRQTMQHHHAHIAAVLLEHGELNREVLGLAWDGTGYGDDGTVWGGECLRATGRDYRRVAHLRLLPMVGGERAIREPWRVATAAVADALGPDTAAQLAWPDVAPAQVQSVITAMSRPRLSPSTSSMGRLFDVVAALTLGTATAEDDGRPAMLLEQSCDVSDRGMYAFDYQVETGMIDWRPVVAGVVGDLHRGTSPGAVAMRFHRAVAELAGLVAAAHPDLPLVTAGGVFQNAVLVELLIERVADRGTGWLRSQIVPPGDGGLAAGQLAVAAARWFDPKS